MPADVGMGRVRETLTEIDQRWIIQEPRIRVAHRLSLKRQVMAELPAPVVSPVTLPSRYPKKFSFLIFHQQCNIHSPDISHKILEAN